MEHDNIELMRKEGERLLRQQLSLLNEMLIISGLVKGKSKDHEQTFDKESIKEHIAVLDAELIKLDKLDMVLAVVGTMKSGKSTTNNAIVGLEVLPNRNRPMTALPTLIRHTPGQVTPKLIFNNNKPINALIDRLVAKLNTPEGSVQLDNSGLKKDIEELVIAMASDYRVNNEYESDQGVFDFLKELNDLVRLASVLDEAFPFDFYRTIEELPVIEVEFQHLRNSKGSTGRLALLDTPGPNEEGQMALKAMLREQLGRASAVLAVLDYTQLKSESDAEVRRELLDIAEVAEGRLYILVNKFDQKDRHGDDEETVKGLVANDLLQGKISPAHVFPVSSKFAYLANRARSELALNGRLPGISEAEWVQDFAEEALGRRWEKELSDLDKVKEAIEDLWADSLFETPLKEVIQHAHSRAAIFAIDSAASKLVDSGDKVNNFLGTRETALKKSADDLQENIKNLERQKCLIEACESKTTVKIDDISNSLRKAILDNTKTLQKNLSKNLEQYFSEGRTAAKTETTESNVEIKNRHAKKKRNSEDSGQNSIFDMIMNGIANVTSRLSDGSEDKDFDPNSEIISFSKKQSAIDLLNRISKASENEFTLVEMQFSKMLENIKEYLRKESDSVEVDAIEILLSVKKELNNGDFELKIRLPDIKPIDFSFNVADVLENMVKPNTETVTKQRRQKGTWGSVCRFFGTDDWGWESYESTKKTYEVNVKEIRLKVLHSADKVFSRIKKVVAKDIISPIEESNKIFFGEFASLVENVRGDLLEGLKDNKRSKREKEELTAHLDVLKHRCSLAEVDRVGLKEDVYGAEMDKSNVEEAVV